jgi:hypothetical protein
MQKIANICPGLQCSPPQLMKRCGETWAIAMALRIDRHPFLDRDGRESETLYLYVIVLAGRESQIPSCLLLFHHPVLPASGAAM